jgi:aryl-phospho-beta-D-glucosidase BglC (GH1 family)
VDLNIILDFHYYDALMINPKANTARFTAIWRQIARRFASRPDGHLWFELLNEPVKGITNADLMDVLGPAQGSAQSQPQTPRHHWWTGCQLADLVAHAKPAQ